MNCCYRFAINFIIIVAINGIFLTSSVHSLPNSDQITLNEFLQMGVKNIVLSNYQQAIQYFTQAIELNSNFAAAYSNRCLAYLQLEEYHNAIADCTYALNFVPDNTEAYLNRGLAEYRLGNYQGAILDDNRVIQLKPHDFRAYYNRGIANAALKNYFGAIEDYNLALTQTPQLLSSVLGDIYNDRGLVEFELQNFSAAFLDFSKAIRLNSTDDRGYFNRGCTCAKNQDNWGALRDFTQVVKLNPQNAIAYVNRGVAYHNLGYEQAAIKDLQTAAAYFVNRGETIAYQRTVKLIETVQQQIASQVEIG
jgi:tetratricopeptide (TPR) repeat protein